MPAKSKKQKKFMQAVANNPEFAKKVGVKQSIGQEFTKEKDMDKRTKSIMNEKDEIRRVDKEIRDNEGYKAGGMLARTGGSNAPMDAKGKKMFIITIKCKALDKNGYPGPSKIFGSV